MLNHIVGFVTNQKIFAYFFQIVSYFLVVYSMFCSNRVIVFDICNVFGKNSKKTDTYTLKTIRTRIIQRFERSQNNGSPAKSYRSLLYGLQIKCKIKNEKRALNLKWPIRWFVTDLKQMRVWPEVIDFWPNII